MKKWYHENCWHLIKLKQQIETCKTTEMTKTKRLKRNEPNDSNEKTKIDQNSTQKKSEIKITPRGHLNYVLPLIYLMGKFSYLYITISLTWDVERTFLKKKINTKVTYINVVNEYHYLFLPLLTLWYSIWLAFRPENYI